MSEVELRQYLEILKRHKWFILESMVIVGLVAGILSSLRTPMYQATAKVLLRPNNPSEQLDPNSGARQFSNDPDRYVKGQEDIVESEAVASEAAKLVPGIGVSEIEDRSSVAQGGESDILKISATDVDPRRARDIANAVARGYIENRRVAAVSGLQQAADEIGGKLPALLARIAQLDAQIAALAPATGLATATPQPPAGSSAAPLAQPTPPDPALAGLGGQATTQEALKAARYSSALQYETQYARSQELLVDISLKRGEAELIAEAKRPTAPISPQPKRDAILGMVVGLVFGFGMSVLREQLNDRVRSTDEAERLTGLPLLAQLPFEEEVPRKGGGVAIVDSPGSPLSEAVRSLRTSIHYLGIDEPVKTIIVTSATPGDGKSLVAANLAVAFADANFRTVLISADLRRPTLDRAFASEQGSLGLTGIVAPVKATTKVARTNGHEPTTPARGLESGGNSLGLLATDVPNLSFLPAGDTPPNPAELLGSRRMTELLESLKLYADIILIDTPPLLPVTDAAVLATKADGVVLVAAVNETRREAMARAAAILEATGARTLGIVLNKAKRSGSTSYYYARYYGDDSKGRRERHTRRRSRRSTAKSQATAP